MRCLRAVTLLLLLTAKPAGARDPRGPVPFHDLLGGKGDSGAFILDGSFVHNAGELQVNITNWGLIGSRPGEDSTYSVAPSAMWPAGSGTDYLYAAGLWVGAIKAGVPLVSTGQYANEFLPGTDPRETIYRTGRGKPGGGRYPFSADDDDNDGRIDEDPPDGFDNDNDGRIDEDFAAIGDQHFRFRMRDDWPLAEELWPDHDPLEIEVVQSSHQWATPRLEDAIAFEYTIRNVGVQDLEEVAVGFFADGDIGDRNDPDAGADDMVGFVERTVIASDGAPIRVSLAYMYDCEDRLTPNPGYLGFFFINQSRIPVPAPVQGFSYFAGIAPFEEGGDPNNDAERYQVLTNGVRRDPPPSCRDANDYRVLISTRPPGGFRLRSGQSLTLQVGMAIGETVDDLVETAAELILTYYGDWYDRDADPSTGNNGRETRVCKDDFQDPRDPNPNPIFNLYIDCAYPPNCDPFQRAQTIRPNDLDDEGCVWINTDCSHEESRGTGCGFCTGDPDTPGYNACTGILGKEHNVRWIADSPPPAPAMRIWNTHNRVHVLWRSEHEDLADPITGAPLFEGYRLWRVDGWSRPLGSSTTTGPETKDWQLIAEFDRVSFYERRTGPFVEEFALGPNTGLDIVHYQPEVTRPGHPVATEFAELAELVDRILEENPGQVRYDIPIRFADPDGTVSDWGAIYPELREWEPYAAQLDTLTWDGLGLGFYEFVDDAVANGLYYFFGVTVTTVGYDEEQIPIGYGEPGSPRNNFRFGVPRPESQTREQRDREGNDIFVVPNPATDASLAEFSQLSPNADDPTGVRVEFRNLPRARNKISVFTLSGDLVAEILHDGTNGSGAASWNLVSRNGQEIVDGVYLYAVESSDGFERVIGRFVVVR